MCAVAIHTTYVAQEQRTTKPNEASYGSEDLEVSLSLCTCACAAGLYVLTAVNGEWDNGRYNSAWASVCVCVCVCVCV